MANDYYATLGVSRNATPEEIYNSLRKLDEQASEEATAAGWKNVVDLMDGAPGELSEDVAEYVLELSTSRRGTREDYRRVAPHLMTLLWIAAAIAFTVAVHFRLGHVRMFEFVTGYLIEYALSVDNVFVFMVVFSHFQVPEEQRRWM